MSRQDALREVLPCPMCGAEPVLDGRTDDVRVRCEECGVQGPTAYFDCDDFADIDRGEAEAIEKWNRRTGPALLSGGGDWMPIETAPKDGETEILVWSACGEACIGIRPIDCPDDAVCDRNWIAFDATHWMPLPPAPAMPTTPEASK